MVRSLNTAKANVSGLRVWSFLADRLAQLTTLHKRLTELPKTSTENESAVATTTVDLTVMYAFSLAPLFLAGNSADPISVSYWR